IADEATPPYEEGRAKAAPFIGAPDASQIVFTKNVTEAINLVAYSWGRTNLAEGDVVVLTQMEHHANVVPWLQLKAERGIELRYLGLTPEGDLDLTGLDEILAGAKLVTFTAM